MSNNIITDYNQILSLLKEYGIHIVNERGVRFRFKKFYNDWSVTEDSLIFLLAKLELEKYIVIKKEDAQSVLKIWRCQALEYIDKMTLIQFEKALSVKKNAWFPNYDIASVDECYTELKNIAVKMEYKLTEYPLEYSTTALNSKDRIWRRGTVRKLTEDCYVGIRTWPKDWLDLSKFNS